MKKTIPNNEKTRSAMYSKEFKLGKECRHAIKNEATETVLNVLTFREFTRQQLIDELKSFDWKNDKINNTLNRMKVDKFFFYAEETNKVIVDKEKCHKTNGLWFLD